MSRTPGSIKAETHERIVETAGRAIRAHGYDGASVADVMKQAGLTHGGFYAHFASREAMLEEAIDRAADDGRGRLRAVADRAEPGHALEAIIASYLSDRHVEHPESGCTLAALGSETRRQAPALRRIATRQVGGLADLIAAQLPGGDTADNRDRALATLCGMVGALSLSRAVDDPALARALRDAVARAATGAPAAATAPEPSPPRSHRRRAR
ncbi:MAG TPA: TetR/AcrR family transcriptional regulator [Kofleriaceae bacterium]|jgi:AcrR family transcriptional regulator|nr:TetR/AcrR family transcriptional regulator [Kofleriaceae bacterium]